MKYFFHEEACLQVGSFLEGLGVNIYQCLFERHKQCLCAANTQIIIETASERAGYSSHHFHHATKST